MDRLGVYAKSLREGSLLTVLVLVPFVATVFVHVVPSQAAQSGDDAVVRHLVQYYMRVGQQQFEQGYYIEAEKTFQMAQGYTEYLEPLERRKLESLLEKAGLAAKERRRVLEVRQTAESLRRQGDLAAARTDLDQIKDSPFLTKKEREEVADTLRGLGQLAAAGAGGTDAPESGGSPASSPRPPAARPDAGDTLERYKNNIAELYYESVKAYHGGELKVAKEGFAKVLQSGLMPVPMAETIRGYLADIEATEAKQGNGRPVVLADESAQAWSAVGTTVLANTPANFRAQNTPAAEAPPGERQRIEELYNQSWELYSQGELVAARRGFVEVAESGLFTAPPGKRPEDYIATIDRLLASSAQAAPPAMEPRPEPIAPPEGVSPVAEEPAPEGTGIEIINRRRNIIRTYVESVVNDAVDQAQRLMAQREFDAAMERVDAAQRAVNAYQLYLGDELYRQHTRRLSEVAQRIRAAQTDREGQLAEQRRMEAAQTEREYRKQAEIDRQQRIDELLQRAKAYWKQQQYDAALGQLEALLAIDPLHDEALGLKQTVEDMIFLRRQLELQQLNEKERAGTLLRTAESTVPYENEITYSKDWREIIQRPTRQPEEPLQLDPANVLVYKQLNEIVDLSMLSSDMPISEAVEILRNSVTPPLNIVMLWRDLEENANITASDPINMDGLPNVRLGTALENLISAISNPLIAEVDYVVNRGVVTVATIDSLPRKKMETRVYDIADLVGQPANYFGMGGGMMGMMGGGMMGGMGGYGGGMMGGGMMGGMGGYGGGLGGGYGGGLGGYGGGMGGYGGGLGGGYGGGLGGYGGGMGGYGGGMMGGYGGGMGGYGGGMMGGYGGGMMGGMGGGYMSIIMAQSLRQLIQESIEPETWYDLYPDTAEGTVMVFPDQSPKKLAVYQSPEVHEQIEDLLNQLRRALGHEVAIEARFLVVTENFLEDIGLDLDFSYNFGGKWGVFTVDQDSFLTAAPDITTRVPGSLGGLTNNPAATVTGGYGSILDDLQVSLLLRATQARTDSKALAAPKVTVISGEGASFTLYDTVAYALPPTVTTQQAVGGVGAGLQQQGQYQNVGQQLVGSTLSITPTITKDKKYVLLNIVSQQTDLLRLRTLQVEQTNPNTTAGAPPTVTVDVTVPEIETGNLATRVSVPDRGTLLLGGHKLTQEIDKEVGVPVLSKIPLLGRLFTNRSTLRDQKILLILVKPTIILQEEAEQEAIAAMEETVTGL